MAEFKSRPNSWRGPVSSRGAKRRISLSGFLIAAAQIASADWAVLGACAALAVATGLFIFYIRPDASDLAPHRSKLDQLLERRDTIYDNLRDLRFKYRAGKYSETDYETMKNSMETEAALVLAEIDQATDSVIKRPRGPKPAQRGAH
jgi:hypothetical protein